MKRVNASIFDKVKKLPVSIIEGEITIYHTEGYEDRALMLGQMMEGAKEFFEQSLGVSADINLAVLDRSHWLQVSEKIPYGIPCADWGYVVCLPATIDAGNMVSFFLGMSGKASQSVLDKLKSHNLTYDDAARMMIDIVGFHELGHIYNHVYGLTTHRRWFEEMAASYFACAYMDHMDTEHQEWLAVLEGMNQTTIDTLDPAYTAFEDFENIYAGVSDVCKGNYSWYQAMFGRRVSAIYPEHGLSFPEEAKAALESDRKLTDAELLARLEEIAPGFIQWAEKVENWSFSAKQATSDLEEH